MEPTLLQRKFFLCGKRVSPFVALESGPFIYDNFLRKIRLVNIFAFILYHQFAFPALQATK